MPPTPEYLIDEHRRRFGRAATLIGRNCTLGPAVYVASGAVIGHGAVVRESIVLRGASVPDGAHIVRQVIA